MNIVLYNTIKEYIFMFLHAISEDTHTGLEI